MKMQNLNKGDGTYFGPEDELSTEDTELCEKLALRELADDDGFNINKNLQIDDETIQVPGQTIALVAFIGPYNFLRAKHPVFQLNLICGCADPQSALRKLRKNTDHRYDIYTLGMYEWIALPPNEEFMKDPKAHEEFLNSIIIRHKKDLLLRKHLFEFRKTRIMESKKVSEVVEETRPLELESLPETKIVTSEVPVAPDISDVPEVPEVRLPASPPVGEFEGTEDWDPAEKLDEIGLRSQQWVILSTVGTLETGFAIKIQGFYETEDAARKVLDRIRQMDDTFETYVAEAGRWLPANVRAEDIPDQVFQNEHLTELFRNHRDEKQKALDFSTPKSSGPTIEPVEILDGLEEDVSKVRVSQD
jgi:hypothetical protein